MKIINTYLIPMVRSYGGVAEIELVEVVQLENGMVFEVKWMKGSRKYVKMDIEQFHKILKTDLLEHV